VYVLLSLQLQHRASSSRLRPTRTRSPTRDVLPQPIKSRSGTSGRTCLGPRLCMGHGLLYGVTAAFEFQPGVETSRAHRPYHAPADRQRLYDTQEQEWYVFGDGADKTIIYQKTLKVVGSAWFLATPRHSTKSGRHG
jgi:hypothetical protein